MPASPPSCNLFKDCDKVASTTPACSANTRLSAHGGALPLSRGAAAASARLTSPPGGSVIRSAPSSPRRVGVNPDFRRPVSPAPPVRPAPLRQPLGQKCRACRAGEADVPGAGRGLSEAGAKGRAGRGVGKVRQQRSVVRTGPHIAQDESLGDPPFPTGVHSCDFQTLRRREPESSLRGWSFTAHHPGRAVLSSRNHPGKRPTFPWAPPMGACSKGRRVQQRTVEPREVPTGHKGVSPTPSLNSHLKGNRRITPWLELGLWRAQWFPGLTVAGTQGAAF